MVSRLMTIKAVLISTGVASVGLLLKVSVPVAVDFSVSQAPILWSSLLSWLKPPYLYILTNGIIITIVASSKYYRSTSHHDEEDDGIVYGGGGDYKLQTELIVHDQASPRMLEVKDLDLDRQFDFIKDVVETVEDEDGTESELKSVTTMESSDLIGSGGGEDVMLPTEISKGNHMPPRMTESENIPPAEKPLVSSRFGHRKSVKASQEGGRSMLRVTKPKRNETLENTWKMITEGKSTTLTKQLYRRSDTFSRGDSGHSGEARPVYKKSETFRDRTNFYQSQETAAKGKVRKEPSLSQDELNRRVEAFIKKFNEDMKLQRMESLRQYQEITGRGV
ncbi:BnaA09g13800D [Brassica napus]|uniref:BnaA09g13800D protein n=1 Tax=Brassica napus TaxID=3708 RepID=A0A078FIS7_BRANA|nr:BnaA09g13800D [Brassica napus]